MSCIRSKATLIEVSLQKALWRRGVRYRKNYRRIPGSPDIAIVRYKIAIFCDGEFWHGRDWEQNKHRIKSNREFWVDKIERNITRDKQIEKELHMRGWHVIRFWETEIKSDLDGCVETVLDLIRQARSDTRPVLYTDFSYHNVPLMVAEEARDDYSTK